MQQNKLQPMHFYVKILSKAMSSYCTTVVQHSSYLRKRQYCTSAFILLVLIKVHVDQPVLKLTTDYICTCIQVPLVDGNKLEQLQWKRLILKCFESTTLYTILYMYILYMYVYM